MQAYVIFFSVIHNWLRVNVVLGIVISIPLVQELKLKAYATKVSEKHMELLYSVY